MAYAIAGEAGTHSFKGSAQSTLAPAEYVETEFEVRPIRNAHELDEVYRITYEAYLEQGYCAPQADGRLIHFPQFDHHSETTIFVALQQGKIVGSLSVTLDGSNGLPVDEDFKTACDRIRYEGHYVANGWRMVTRKEYRHSRHLVFSVLREAIHHCLEVGVRTCLYCVNPKHERAYQKMLNWKTVARKKEAKGLQNAEAVLMRMDEDGLSSWLMTKFKN